MIQRVFLVLLLCAFGFACGDDDSSDVTTVDSGGDGDGDGDGDGAVTLSGDVQPIFDASCASVACHDSQNPAQGLDLSSGASQAALVGVNSTASACSDEVLVVAGDSSSSYLLDKIDGTQACGSPMADRARTAAPTMGVMAPRCELQRRITSLPGEFRR